MKADQDRLPRRMSRRPRKLPFLVLALLTALVLSACGNASERVTTGTYAGEGGVAAPYLDVGPLIYQVQISRQLNPFNAEESAYLQGLTPAERKLEPGEEWFAVFIQVFNNSSHPHAAATTLSLSDTQNNVFVPVVPDQTNQFAYRGGLIPAGGRLPELGSVAANGPSQGAMVLFKIPVATLVNRPIRIHIVDPQDATQTASAELDV